MKQRHFEDVRVGAELPVLDKGPMTAPPFSREVDHLPDILVNGSWKQQVLCQFLKDWAGPAGWLWRIRFRFHDMDIKNTAITVTGAVTELAATVRYGYVRCSLQMLGDGVRVTTSGEGIVVLPLRRGAVPMPYPFLEEASPLAW